MKPIWTATEAVAATGGHTSGAWQATGVSIDTRTLKPGDLFVALTGENRDAHAFVSTALSHGASAALVSKPVDGVDPARLLLVKDTQAGLEAMGLAARARTGARVAAVTGSVGKTSTKEALRSVLSAQGFTHASEASYNNMWGVPLTLARMPRETAFGVFEIGMNHSGEIRPLTRQVQPDAAMVTTVEAAHLGNFSGIEEIAAAKAEIFEGLKPGGVAIINADNPHAPVLAAAANAVGARIWTFGEHGTEARLNAVSLGPDSSVIEADLMGEQLRFIYGAPGRHFVQNALGLLLVVKALGADVKAAAAALAGVRAPKGRGAREVINTADGPFVLLDESYNANPASVRAALAVLKNAMPGPGGRRIAILGDMLEMGTEADTIHASLADDVAQAADLVFACGPAMSHLFANLPHSIRGAHASSSADFAGDIAAAIRAGDVVMVKGSLGSRMALVTGALKARAHQAAAE